MKVTELERELKREVSELEKGALSGDYSKVLRKVRTLKAYLHVIKTQKLWSKGNKYFALLEQVENTKEAVERRSVKELEESLSKIEKLLME